MTTTSAASPAAPAPPIRVALLGGYGITGRRMAELLAVDAGFAVRLVGRDAGRLWAAAAELGGGVETMTADVADAGALAEAVAACDIVVSATCAARLAPIVARAALAAGRDYMDIHLSSPAKWAALGALAPEAASAGRTLITDAGLHPGLPGILIRDAARTATLTRAEVFGAFNADWRHLRPGGGAGADFAAELAYMDPSTLVDGRWRRDGRQVRRHDFGAAAGVRACVPMALAELRALPAALPTLSDMGFYVAGFGALVDTLALPLALVLARIPGGVVAAGGLLGAALRTLTPTRPWAVVDLAATGDADGRPVTIATRVAAADPYDLTAAAAVACLEQYRDGRRHPGLIAQAAFVEPAAFLASLAAKGVTVSRAVRPASA